MAKNGDKLEKARAKASQSLAQLGRVEAREETRLRELDTKRKILLGAALQTMMKADAKLRARVKAFMKSFVRLKERDVFGFSNAVTYFDTLCSEADAAAEVEAAVDGLTATDTTAAGADSRRPAPAGPARPPPPTGGSAPNGGAARPPPSANASTTAS